MNHFYIKSLNSSENTPLFGKLGSSSIIIVYKNSI